jgi:hypothetical protein
VMVYKIDGKIQTAYQEFFHFRNCPLQQLW